MSQSIDIVVHVYSAVLPHYAKLLRMQVQSLIDHAPEDCEVQLIVGCTKPHEDQATWNVIDGLFDGNTTCSTPYDDRLVTIQRHGWLTGQVRLRAIALPKGELFRRAILRHQWSQTSEADVIWMADVDYVCGDGTIAAILAQVQKTDGLCFPREYWIHNDHETGDRALASGKIDPADFHQRPSKLAIGGMQIIGADAAKRIGYLGNGRRGKKWQQPENPDVPFRCFRDDSTWRRVEFPDGGREIDVPNLFRLRHSLGAKGSRGPANKDES